MANPYTVLVEGMIFAAGKSGVEYKFVLEKVPALDKSDLQNIIDELKVKYPDDGTSGVVLYDFGKVLSFVTHTSIGEQLAEALKRKKQKELSTALLEVLAIIAYQQPITKAEVEQIREGRNCDYAIGALCEANLIEVKGRKDTLGRPKLYGTTQNFLERFELKSIRSLPSKHEIEERIKIISLEAERNEMLFREKDDALGRDDDVTEVAVEGYTPTEAADYEEDEAPVGAGEEGGYDDTDYDEVAADETQDADDDVDFADDDVEQEEPQEEDDAYSDEEEVWDDSDDDNQ
jgi:segregation and condensation protein B